MEIALIFFLIEPSLARVRGIRILMSFLGRKKPVDDTLSRKENEIKIIQRIRRLERDDISRNGQTRLVEMGWQCTGRFRKYF